MNTVQGRCTKCHVRHTWNSPPLVRDAKCPDCGFQLLRTTHLLRLPVKHWPCGLGVTIEPVGEEA